MLCQHNTSPPLCLAGNRLFGEASDHGLERLRASHACAALGRLQGNCR